MDPPPGGARISNTEIARALLRLADAIDVAGGADVGFRVRALRAGAQAIDALPAPAVELATQGKLTEYRGIGQGIARRVEELARTGTLVELEELRGAAAPGLVDLVTVEGVGPKTARLVHERLGVSTLDELEAAARAGKLRALPRLGARREAQILESIARARASRGRIRLDRAEAEARPVVERLRRVPEARRVEVAGSLRRRRDTVADVDLLVATDEPGPVMAAFVAAPQVAGVVARGPTRASVKLRSGLQLDLRAVPPESFGAALHYFTGSRGHNIAVRALGVRRGLKINEYGVFDVSEEQARGRTASERAARARPEPTTEGRRIGGAEEADVFRAVGLAWIPPELREDRGEIQAAAQGRLPELIRLEQLRGDLHMHTVATDGRATLEEMVAAAGALGREYVAITDHSEALKMVGGLDAARLRAQGRAIRALDERLGGRPRILRGVEADILSDGTVDLGPEVLRELDWVVGSVHSHFRLPRAEQTRRIVRAIESGLIDVLGHPTGRILEERSPYDVDLEAIVAAAARTGVALELNSYPDRLDLDDANCRLARDAGVSLVIDSDSHATSHLAGLAHGIDVARRGWLEARHVLNTHPVEFVLEHVRARRNSRQV